MLSHQEQKSNPANITAVEHFASNALRINWGLHQTTTTATG
jgi:hypothetical protein